MADLPKPVRLARQSASMKIRAVGRKWSPFDDLYHFLLMRSWLAFFSLVGGLFIFLNALFAGLYLIQPGCIANAHSSSFEDAFFFSVQTMATIGYGNMAPITRFAHIVVTVEALTGMLGVALMTGLTFSKFARPKARVLFGNRAVLTVRDGVPHLQFRMANFRHNQILEAQLRVVLMVNEETREGERLRLQTDIPLVRDWSSLLVLTWTAMHRVDEKSPFYGEGALKRLRERGASLVLTLSGFDETTGQTLLTFQSYSMNDIVENARFADVLTVAEDGTREVDYSQFNDLIMLVELPPAASPAKAPEAAPEPAPAQAPEPTPAPTSGPASEPKAA